MLSVVEHIEPNVPKVVNKGNEILLLGDFLNESAFRENISNLPRSVAEAKRKLKERKIMLEEAVDKFGEFNEIASQLKKWIATEEPVLSESIKTTNPVVIEKRLKQVEVIIVLFNKNDFV